MKWKAICPQCGPVMVERKTKPTTCKTELQLSERCRRQCRHELTYVTKVEDINQLKLRI